MGDWYDDFEIGGILEGIVDVVEGISEAFGDGSSNYVYRSRIDEESHEKALLRNGGWRCRCGNINASYVGTCQCGGTKQDDAFAYDEEKREQYRVANAQKRAAQRPAPPSGWMCECGKRNAGYQAYCSCGGAQSDGIPCAEYVEEPSLIRMRPIEPANRTPVQPSPAAKPAEASTAAPVRTEVSKPAEPVIPIVEAQDEPVIPVVEAQEEPLIPIVEAQEEPLIPIVEAQEEPLIPIVEAQEEPLIPIVEAQEEPLIPIVEAQEEPLIPIMEEKEEPLIPGAKPQEKSVFSREEVSKVSTVQKKEEEREDIFGLNPKPTGNKRFENPFYNREEKEWKCPKCGAMRPSFMAICECGASKRRI